MRCNRRRVMNGDYRRYRRIIRWIKNSGSGARRVKNNKRKMGGQNFHIEERIVVKDKRTGKIWR